MKRSFLRIGISVLLITGMFAGCATQGVPTSPEGLAHLVSSKSEPYVLVDVRTAEEYASGHIPSAINVPVATLEQNLPTEDRGALIIVYCQSGGRSRAGKAALVRLGFTRVVDFGSILKWKGVLITGTNPTGGTGS
jgi:rhodanese-related sulfurtransferase